MTPIRRGSTQIDEGVYVDAQGFEYYPYDPDPDCEHLNSTIWGVESICIDCGETTGIMLTDVTHW